MRKNLRYLRYLFWHKLYVFVECLKMGLLWQGLTHDLSKFRPSEWGPYLEYFYGDKYLSRENIVQVGGPHLVECYRILGCRFKEDVEADYDWAWLLHQHRNPHHWQFYILREDLGWERVLPMPDRYRKEMLADWKGAGRALGKPDTRAWYLKNRCHIRLYPDTQAWIEERLGVVNE